jgi:hypothetical protein
MDPCEPGDLGYVVLLLDLCKSARSVAPYPDRFSISTSLSYHEALPLALDELGRQGIRDRGFVLLSSTLIARPAPPPICTRPRVPSALPLGIPCSLVRLVASLTALGVPQLVHLGHSLLELDVLTLLVAVSLVLRGIPVNRQQLRTQGEGTPVPRTSTGGSRYPSDTD